MQSVKILNVYKSNSSLIQSLDVIEYLECEPAMYIYEDGYLCEDYLHKEYFISFSGRVDLKDDGKWIMGWRTCPKLKNEFDLIAAIGEET